MKRQIPYLFFFIATTLLFISCKKDLQHAPVTSHDLVSATPQGRMATAAISTTSWMKSLPNSYLLSQLSVPGSHDAGAR